jgi:membrane-associated PAP2 superfamily phosphatase
MKTDTGRNRSEPVWIGAALLLLALAWDTSGLDLPLARLAGNAGGFPLRDQWWLATVAHTGGRWLAWLLALALCLGVSWPVGPLARITPRARLQLALGSLLAALAVAWLKDGNHTSCPWDLAEFGGVARYLSHWSLGSDGGSGRCFPAGHAASGFSFIGGYFAFRDTQPRMAWGWLASALAAGLAFGIAQQWRGAHFMSHTLWSAVVCWNVAWGVALAGPLLLRVQA